MRKREEIQSCFDPTDALEGKRSFYLVGIGGAGMSALARMLKHRGMAVKGSDSTSSTETARLNEEGIGVTIGHHSGAVAAAGDIEALIVTDALDLASSPEVADSRALGIPVVRRSQALGWLLRPYRVIAVTGTHGKTTTTGMLGAGLIAAGLDPLVVVGASIPAWAGPIHEGTGAYAVVEACEAYDAFHDIDPYIVVLTNLELDHVDFHGSYENLRASVTKFANAVPKDGALVFCADDAGAAEVARLCSAPVIGYNLQPDGSPDAKLALPGSHNRTNANAAVCVASLLQAKGEIVDLDLVRNGVSAFTGAERRLQTLHEGEIVVVDDYAHHPTEIQASIRALREKFISRVIVVFQPHLYSRTEPLIAEFAAALSLADEVFITDIYPAREAPVPGVSASRIAELVTKPVHYVPSRHLLPSAVAQTLQRGDVVVGMGAGNISEFAPGLISELARRDRATAFRSSALARNGPPGKLNVTVLFGGDSAEREVSLHSGLAVKAALSRLGHTANLVDMTELLFTTSSLAAFVGPNRPDLVFLATHGTHAEDGAIQGLLELLHLPYTGSGIQASAIAMDKAMTKRVLAMNDILVPKGTLLEDPDQPFSIRPPLIVKPNAQGSTVGLSFVERGGDVCGAIRRAFSYDTQVLVEEWIVGMEISTPVLRGVPLPTVEIVPNGGRYDFVSKYAPGATEEIVPARLSPEQVRSAQDIALRAHRALGCTGATRTDAIVRGEEIYVLEVNTLPGLTTTSLLPNSAAAAGISFDDLCQSLVEDAFLNHAQKHSSQST